MFDFLFMEDKYCYFCKRELAIKNHLCKKCLDRLDYKERIIDLDGIDAHILFFYNDIFKKILADYKFEKNTSLAKVFEKFLYAYIKDKKFDTFDYLLPSPSSKKSINKRGFDHIRSLSDPFIGKTSMTYLESFKKIKDTKAQHTLARDERRVNLKGAFYLDEDLTGKKILLLDDLITTGETVKEIVKVLKDKNPEEIIVLALASERAKN